MWPSVSFSSYPLDIFQILYILNIVQVNNFLRRFFYKVQQVCSGDLYGYKISIPCNAEKYFENSYGKKWKTPIKQGFEHHNYGTEYFFTKSEYAKVLKHYKPNGEFDTNYTLKMLNEGI